MITHFGQARNKKEVDQDKDEEAEGWKGSVFTGRELEEDDSQPERIVEAGGVKEDGRERTRLGQRNKLACSAFMAKRGSGRGAVRARPDM